MVIPGEGVRKRLLAALVAAMVLVVMCAVRGPSSPGAHALGHGPTKSEEVTGIAMFPDSSGGRNRWVIPSPAVVLDANGPDSDAPPHTHHRL